jgi:hypothetical protein
MAINRDVFISHHLPVSNQIDAIDPVHGRDDREKAGECQRIRKVETAALQSCLERIFRR